MAKDQLTPDSLVSYGRPALLHVREPMGGRTIRHAVALLGVDAEARTATVGYPLFGKQIKGWNELEGYRIGEGGRRDLSAAVIPTWVA